MGGGRIVPLQARPNILSKIIYDPFLFAKNSFFKI
jgi:hypothetical protein